MNTDSCDMRRVERKGSILDLATGEFYFLVDEAGQRHFVAMFPGDTPCSIPIRPVVVEGLNGGHYWDWDGNEDKPTLNPSVHSVGSWHGWVRAGRMESC